MRNVSEIDASNAELRPYCASHTVYHVTASGLDGYFCACEKKSGRRGYETWDANIKLATEAAAKLLGLSDTIPHSEFVWLRTKENVTFGLFQQTASGKSVLFCSPEKRRSMITPEFQRAMSNMQLLDTVCHESDHTQNNYKVIRNATDQAIGVSVFDNNGIGTFPLRAEVRFPTPTKIDPLLGADGFIHRPCMDTNTAKRLLKLRFSELCGALRPYLGFIPLFCTWKRVCALKTAIRRTAAANAIFLLKDGQWNEQTIEEELSGRYGKTYLWAFLEDCVVSET